MKRILAAAILLSSTFLFQTESLACSCGRISIDDAFSQYDAVFLGKVLEITKDVGPIGRWFYQMHYRFKGGVFDDTIYYMSVTLSVSKQWKGRFGSTVLVQTADAEVCCICGYDFEVAKTYLVYANGSPLHTSICSRTKPVSDALSEMIQLDKLASKK